MTPTLYALAVITFAPITLAFIAGYFRKKQFGHVDNHLPRQQQSQLTGIAARAHAAQMNAWEALMVFVAVVFITQAAGVPHTATTVPAWFFVGARLFHAGFYMANLAALRSTAFALGMAACGYMVFLAVNHSA